MSNKIRYRKNDKVNPRSPKRVMVFDFYSEMMVEVIKNLQKRDIEIAYWADGKKYFMDNIFENRELFPNTIFHSAQDAITGVPPRDMDVTNFKPLEPSLVEALSPYMAQTLLMMDNIDFYLRIPLMKKMRLYHAYMWYWYGVLTTLKPDAVIFYDAPHMAYKFVVYCLAKQLNIKIVVLVKTPIGGRLIITRDLERYEKLEKRLDAIKDKTFTEEDWAFDIRDYYQNQRTMDKYPFYIRPHHIEKNTYHLFHLLPRVNVLWRHIKQGTLLKTARSYFQMMFGKRLIPNAESLELPFWKVTLQEKRWKKVKDGFREEYQRYQQIPDYSKKYIYVSLHNQPECSTNPLGGVFVDQILMIDILSRSVPDNWIIYVKENPLQWSWPRTHAGRFEGYTKDMVQRRNVFVVPVETSTFDLIKNAQAVAAVTSTAMLEGILRGKPALVFGCVWFMYCAGAFPIRSVDSLQSALKQIQRGAAPNRQKIINFLKAFGDVSLCGYRDYRFKHGEDLNMTLIKDDHKNIRSFSEALYKELIEN